MQKDFTKWLTNNETFNFELELIRKAEKQAKKELRQERKRWSNFNYKLA